MASSSKPLPAAGWAPLDREEKMIPETAATLMAIAKLGAIGLPIFSGYAADAVAVRLADAGAKALVTADGFYRRGKIVDITYEGADEGIDRLSRKYIGRDYPWRVPGRRRVQFKVQPTSIYGFDRDPIPEDK